MPNTSTNPDILSAVRQMLIDRFDLDELRDLCFALGIDYAVFPQWCAGMARELIVYVVRHNQMTAMLEKIRKLRPDINIPAYLKPEDNFASPRKAPAHNTQNPDAIILAWSKALGSKPCAGPIVMGDVIMVPLEAADARGSVLRALTLSHGNTLWELCFEDVTITGFTSCGDNFVLVSLSQIDPYDSEGMLLAVDTRGRELWRYTPGVQLVSAAAVVQVSAMDMTSLVSAVGKDIELSRIDALVAVTTDHQWMQIIDLHSGQHLTEINLSSEAALSAPAFGLDRVFVPCSAPTVLALGVDGEEKWRYDAPVLSDEWMDQTPCVVGNLVIASMRHNTVVALHARDGSMMWETTIGPQNSVLTAPVTDGTRVYIGAGDGTHALHLANGREVWHAQSPAPVQAAPEVWNDIVTVLSADRVIQALDRFTGEVSWQESLDHDATYPPVIVDGDDNGPYAIIVDVQGHAMAMTIPAEPEMHENAGRWKRAALVWEHVGRIRRAAMAWIRYAQVLSERGERLSTTAQAWQEAERLFAILGDEDRVAGCRRENARCLRLPLISLDVEHKGLVVNAWSLLNFSVTNEGYGLARHLVIQTQARQFEGQVAMTQALAHLPPGRSRNRRLDVKPLESGPAVPLTVEVSYIDESDTFHSRDETVYLAVGQRETTPTPASMHVLTQPRISDSERSLQRSAIEVELRINRDTTSDAAYAVEVSLDDGHVFTGGKLSKSLLSWQPGGNPTEDGRFLFNQLVSDVTVRDAWRVAQGEAIAQSLPRRIRLRIGSDVPELHNLPWELLHDGVVMLSANSNTPFSRYLPVPQPWGQPLVTRPIRVLGIISNPKDLHDRYQLGKLDVDLEKYILATAFKGMEQDRVRLEFMPVPVTPENLSSVLRNGYQIVHFVGHGRFVGHSKSAELFMEDQKGYSLPVADQTLARIFSHADIRPHLVFLSVCQSASHSSRDAFVGMAPKLVLAGVPTVIGMQDRVRIATARKITQVFYRRLTAHGYVDQALNEARAALMVSDPSAVQTPVLFMRLQSGRLWDLTL